MNATCLFYLIRHAESTPFGSLTQKGLDQADRLVVHLRPLGITKIFSSPHTRAVQTISPFARAMDIEIQEIEDLREREVSKDVIPDFLEVIRKSWDDLDFCLPGCESARQCQVRVVDAMNQIADEYPGEKIAVSSHGNAIALLLNHIDPSFGFPEWKALGNPDVRKVSRRDGQWRVDPAFSGKEYQELS